MAIEASVPIPYLSIRVISSDSVRWVGGVVIFSFTSNIALEPVFWEIRTFLEEVDDFTVEEDKGNFSPTKKSGSALSSSSSTLSFILDFPSSSLRSPYCL